jgi:drug/metabolite transporter superfamily protein YnfA
MRSAALLVALFTIAVGIVGLVSPDRVTTVRRLYFATPARLYAAGAVRVAMGLVLILCAPASRAPKTLRALGAVVCLQGLAATLLGPDRARAILEWEGMQGTALLRVGAAVALATGGFVAFAVTGHRPESGAK